MQRTEESPGTGASGAPFQGAPRKIDRLSASLAHVFLMKLIRENFSFLPAFRTFAGKGLQTFETLPSRTMCRCLHGISPFLVSKNCYGFTFSSSTTSVPLVPGPRNWGREFQSLPRVRHTFSSIFSDGMNDTSPQAHCGHCPFTMCRFFSAIPVPLHTGAVPGRVSRWRAASRDRPPRLKCNIIFRVVAAPRPNPPAWAVH